MQTGWSEYLFNFASPPSESRALHKHRLQTSFAPCSQPPPLPPQLAAGMLRSAVQVLGRGRGGVRLGRGACRSCAALQDQYGEKKTEAAEVMWRTAAL